MLVMGPDCGTAVVAGVGLGFANVVRPGPVGLVAASGTGAQQVMSLLDAAGVGVSHCLGVGGRDLSAAVGGRSTLAGPRARSTPTPPPSASCWSPSRPPPRSRRPCRRPRRLRTPVRSALLGAGQARPDRGASRRCSARWACDVARAWPSGPAPVVRRGPGAGCRASSAGGTLCDEAMLLAAAELGARPSNIPLRPALDLG